MLFSPLLSAKNIETVFTRLPAFDFTTPKSYSIPFQHFPCSLISFPFVSCFCSIQTGSLMTFRDFKITCHAYLCTTTRHFLFIFFRHKPLEVFIVSLLLIFSSPHSISPLLLNTSRVILLFTSPKALMSPHLKPNKVILAQFTSCFHCCGDFCLIMSCTHCPILSSSHASGVYIIWDSLYFHFIFLQFWRACYTLQDATHLTFPVP